MTQLARPLLVMVLLGGMLMSTLFGQAAAQAAALQALTATPCCPDDCLPKPDCGPACTAVMQCRAAAATMASEIGFGQNADSHAAVTFAMADASDHSVIRGGLRRPPRT